MTPLVHPTARLASFGVIVKHSVLVPELDNVEGRYLQHASRLSIWNVDHLLCADVLLGARHWFQREYTGHLTSYLWLR